jgi:hypothetical protein
MLLWFVEFLGFVEFVGFLGFIEFVGFVEFVGFNLKQIKNPVIILCNLVVRFGVRD